MAQPEPSSPRIASNKHIDADTVRVEWVLRDGRRVVTHTPRERWAQSGHLPVGKALQAMVDELDLQRAAEASRVPD